jgi:hypothetical protein
MDADIATVAIDMLFVRMCYGKEILKTLATDMTMFFHQLLCCSCCMIDAIRATRTGALVQCVLMRLFSHQKLQRRYAMASQLPHIPTR